MREACEYCGGDFRLNVVSDRRSRTKYLRAGCCDAPLRPCPNPSELLRSANLTQDDREYLQRVANLDWFSCKVATVLLQIEIKGEQCDFVRSGQKQAIAKNYI